MGIQYAEAKIKEILKQVGGDQTRAIQRIINESMQDARLMQALAHPHLKGIVAHAVGRVISRIEEEEIEVQQQEDIPVQPEALNMTPGTFGKEILQALSGGGQKFGDEVYVPPSRLPRQRPKKASQSHIDAINQMINKNKSTD
jgi:hypothetical protein